MKTSSCPSIDDFKYIWRRYSLFINKRTRTGKKYLNRNEMWKDRFFTQIIKFAIPTGIVSLIVNIVIECSHSSYITAITDLLAFVSIIIVVLHKKLTIRFKKFFGVTVMMLFSIIKIVTLHSLMCGTVFLLLLSVFVTLLFSKKLAYLSVAVNAMICILFGIALFEGFPIHELELAHDNIPYRWILYSFNFIFSNLVMVSIIIYVISGFEKTILKSENLYIKLRQEVQEKVVKENLLQEAVTHYKSLFFFNPLPMIIYHPTTLRLLYVNKSAIHCYGYNKKEFLDMKVNRLLQCDEETFRNKVRRDYVHQRDRHYCKNGNPILVDINASNIRLNGSWVRLAIIRDITSEAAYIAAIEKKNKKMKEIAHLQSHVIRNPLSRIMGIIELLQSDPVAAEELDQLLSYLMQSAQELDTVVASIVKRTEEEMKED
ncbi:MULTISPECIES: PAS domain-containing protein [unclassified Flavobacterium]|uniref:PAS domain-containing protein n=1 Tax=unclassified Flavobacterium TaxID=196869 RepID=UPI001AC6EEA9|nr:MULTISPECIES: PAS domain-containing protein [unclassified Flavobacterium]MBN9286021.1 PAS domain-containing protein [Flavobacterium sp.]